MKHSLFTLILIAAWGCSSPPPKPTTYPAVGKVQFTGGKPFAGGIVSFTSTTDPRNVMEAMIADDGTFELSMMHGDQRINGALDGKYQVMVSAKFDGRNAVKIYMLPQTFSIEQKSNNLVIEVDPSMVKR
jgi:hypothetical protein